MLDVIEDADELNAIASEWEELWRESPDATPFQSPQWLLPWWKHFGDDKQLTVVIGRDRDGRLNLLAPFCIENRTLMLLGGWITDHLDILGDASAALRVLCERGGWDVADLRLLRRGSSIAEAPVPHGFVSRLSDDVIQPIAPLPAQISSHFRKRLRYDAKRLGDVRFEQTHAFDVLAELHAERWTREGLPGVLADPRIRAFHHDVIDASTRIGMLRMFVMYANERPVGAYYGFLHRGIASYYISGFDPEIAGGGIGNLLVEHAMESAHREGATRFDFLRGTEPYKYRWGARDEPTVRRKIEDKRTAARVCCT